jgi:hypothetical protein
MIRTGRIYPLGAVVAVWATLGVTAPAVGADLGAGPPPVPEAAPPARPWTLTFTPYGWLPGLNGDTTVKGRTTDIDVGPFRVLEHIDGVPWMSYTEARNGRFSFYNDIVYAPLGVDASAARSFNRAALDATLDVDIRQTIIEAGATYEIARWWWSGSASRPNASAGYTAVDVLAGARYWREDVAINLALTATLDASGLLLSRGRAIARERNVDWVDPLVGLRIRHQFAPGQEFVLRGDVGGFDAASQFSWNVLAAYSFDIGVYHGLTYSGLLGYRALSVDFEKGSAANRFEFDMIQHGPLLGLTVGF